MRSEQQRLLRTGKPIADESLMGYIIRLTEYNGYLSPWWIVTRAGLADSTSHCTFRFCLKSYESYSLLAELTGTPSSDLVAMAYSASEEEFNCFLFFGNTVPRHCIRLDRPKFCPECLSEAPYYRRIWDLSIVTTCPKHKCLLIDECPNCGERITVVRNKITTCKCDFDLCEAQSVGVEEPDLILTRHVHQLCGLTTDQPDTTNELSHSPIRRISLYVLLRALLFIAGQYKGRLVTGGIGLIPYGKNRDFHALFTEAFRVFEDWPNNFYRFLQWRIQQERKAPLIRNRLKSTLYQDFGNFYTGLYKILSDDKFSFIRDAFLNFLVEEWNGGLLPGIKKKNLESSPQGKYVMKGDAKRILGADERWLNQSIRTGELKTKVRSKGMKRLIFVNVADIAELIGQAATYR